MFARQKKQAVRPYFLFEGPTVRFLVANIGVVGGNVEKIQ
jgi:hypothetical protein